MIRHRAQAPPTCQLHGYHIPKPLWIERHHVQPLGMLGPDEPGNWLWCCPTGHYDIHALLGPLANGKGMPKGGTASERAAAKRGYDMWVAAGKPGNPAAAYGLHAPNVGN